MAASWIPVPEGSPFPLTNLPYGVGVGRVDGRRRAVVAVGDHAVDLGVVEAARGFDGTGLARDTFAGATLDRFLPQGPSVWSAVRARLADLLTDIGSRDRYDAATVARADLAMDVPVTVGDYADFYSSIHHATNLGRILRPGTEPLLPNWRHLPVGYHGKAGTLVADGASIFRPQGLRLADGRPAYGPSERLDIELEVGTVIGVGSERGRPIPTGAAGDHLFGICLVNDWSARDLQAFEYQPLGPFLAKSFATSMSPWLVTYEALAPFRLPNVVQEPEVAEYLRVGEPWALELDLEVWLQTAAMRADGQSAVRVSRTGFDMYWNAAQHLAHLTVAGAGVRPGDLFASGTVSGAEPGSEGSFIELTRNGAQPLSLPSGEERSFLRDGDTVTLRGWAGYGPDRIGLGAVSGTITSSHTSGGT